MWLRRRGRSFVDEETDGGKFDFAPEPGFESASEFGFGRKERSDGRAC